MPLRGGIGVLGPYGILIENGISQNKTGLFNFGENRNLYEVWSKKLFTAVNLVTITHLIRSQLWKHFDRITLTFRRTRFQLERNLSVSRDPEFRKLNLALIGILGTITNWGWGYLLLSPKVPTESSLQLILGTLKSQSDTIEIAKKEYNRDCELIIDCEHISGRPLIIIVGAMSSRQKADTH